MTLESRFLSLFSSLLPVLIVLQFLNLGSFFVKQDREKTSCINSQKHIISQIIKLNKPGTPFWVCSHCLLFLWWCWALTGTQTWGSLSHQTDCALSEPCGSVCTGPGTINTVLHVESRKHTLTKSHCLQTELLWRTLIQEYDGRL